MIAANDTAALRIDAPQFVAHALPPTALAPAQPRRIGFIKAMLLFWLFPRTMGPHLAARPFRSALAAHISATLIVLIGAVVILAPAMLPVRSGLSLHAIRVALAAFVLKQADASATSTWSWLSALLVIGFVPL